MYPCYMTYVGPYYTHVLTFYNAIGREESPDTRPKKIPITICSLRNLFNK